MAMPGGLRCALPILMATTLAAAADFGALKPEGYVSDFARVLDPATRAQLERYAKGLEDRAGVQMALVTLPTLGGEPVEDVANLLFRKWGIGRKETNEGLLLLLVIQDRRMRLEVGYGLEPIIPDGFAGQVLRSMRPALREGRYGDALVEAAQTLGERIAAAKGVRLEVELPRRSPPPNPDLPWAALLAGLAGLALVLAAARTNRRRWAYRSYRAYDNDWVPALLAAQVLSGPRGFGRASGGFGGFDSSDSFGGFGGGDAGGGGASSSW
ncbi:MAG: TPM domain-containing protein [Bryobacterales bacterium]|nr:TPM domain-containing protein [Bryobacteraceae bacterium]MDW8355175.1 TPM domain-containing protein [Bryobacterales bacterium]